MNPVDFIHINDHQSFFEAETRLIIKTNIVPFGRLHIPRFDTLFHNTENIQYNCMLLFNPFIKDGWTQKPISSNNRKTVHIEIVTFEASSVVLKMFSDVTRN